MMPIGKISAVLAAGALTAGLLAACQKTEVAAEKGPAEKAGQQLDQAAAKASVELNKAAEQAGQALEKAGEKLQTSAKEQQQK